MTTFLLTTILVSVAAAMLGIGAILGRDKPLKGSCRGVADGDGCDACRCAPPAPGARDPKKTSVE